MNYILALYPDVAAQMGACGCKYVKENFDWDVVVGKYKELFEEVVWGVELC